MTLRRAALAVWLLSAPPAAAASAGCGEPPPDRPPQAVGLEGGARGILVAVPEAYDAEVEHRLIVAFHGRTNPAERVRRYYGLEEAAQRPTIVVYPRAERQSDGTFIWRLPQDAALFDAVVERMAAEYCIDRDRIFAVGHSLGATFANTLACARGDALRAVATVAGGIQSTECRGETAALLLHHPQDRLVPVATGQSARDALLAANDLPATPAESFAEPYVCRRYGAADDPAPVAWCLHDQSATRTGRTYAHQWPDGAEAAALAFFRALEGD